MPSAWQERADRAAAERPELPASEGPDDLPRGLPDVFYRKADQHQKIRLIAEAAEQLGDIL